MTTRTHLWRLLALLAAFAVSVTACGSSEDGEASSSDSEANGDAAAVEGNAADTSLDPVRIGVIAQDEELVAFPEVRSAAEAMEGYFNAELGGMDGHPIEAVICGAGDTPESAIGCAQEFVNDDTIQVVWSGTLNTPAVAETMVPAGKPVLSIGNDIPDFLTAGQYTLDPGVLGQAQGVFQLAAEQLSAGTATLFVADDPAFDGFVPVLELLAAGQNITIDQIIRLGFEADLTGPVSAGSEESDTWIFVLADGAQCGAAANAATSLGFEGEVIGNDLCISEELVESGSVDGWYAPLSSAAPVTGTEDYDEIGRILDTYAPGTQRTGFTGLTIGAMQVAYDVVSAAGGPDATAEAVAAELEAYSSDQILGFPAIGCPGPGSFVSACHTDPIVVQAVDGELISSGGFIEIDYSIFEPLLEG
jgi:hypothetical protein